MSSATTPRRPGAAASEKKYRARLQGRINEHKAALGCHECGLRGPPYLLDHHHVDPASKAHEVGRAKSMRLLELELAKCVVLCAIHHRMLHAGDITIEP